MANTQAGGTGALNKPVGTVIERNKPNITLIAQSIITTYKNGATTAK
ncbi:hypothetical protein ABIE66_003194 [Peribacillus sp. B2I2]